jgi:hypothetical protein
MNAFEKYPSRFNLRASIQKRQTVGKSFAVC